MIKQILEARKLIVGSEWQQFYQLSLLLFAVITVMIGTGLMLPL